MTRNEQSIDKQRRKKEVMEWWSVGAWGKEQSVILYLATCNLRPATNFVVQF